MDLREIDSLIDQVLPACPAASYELVNTKVSSGALAEGQVWRGNQLTAPRPPPPHSDSWPAVRQRRARGARGLRTGRGVMGAESPARKRGGPEHQMTALPTVAWARAGVTQSVRGLSPLGDPVCATGRWHS